MESSLGVLGQFDVRLNIAVTRVMALVRFVGTAATPSRAGNSPLAASLNSSLFGANLQESSKWQTPST